MRIAIRKMVEPFDDIQVVGEARTGQMAVEMAENLKPDVITMDVEMPVMDGLLWMQFGSVCLLQWGLISLASCGAVWFLLLTQRRKERAKEKEKESKRALVG
jgi:hypothetical protein